MQNIEYVTALCPRVNVRGSGCTEARHALTVWPKFGDGRRARAWFSGPALEGLCCSPFPGPPPSAHNGIAKPFASTRRVNFLYLDVTLRYTRLVIGLRGVHGRLVSFR